MQRCVRGGDHPRISLQMNLDSHGLPWRERPRAGRRPGTPNCANAWSLTPRLPLWTPPSA